jgi:hypothetical protein
MSGGDLSAASAARCQASATLCQCSRAWRSIAVASAFLEALRPLPEVDYLVHAGKIPNHERRSLTEKVSLAARAASRNYSMFRAFKQ